VNVWERSRQIKGIFYSHCPNIIITVPAFKPNESHKFANSGEIRIEGIKFIDGSILNFLEDIHLGNIKRYCYEYIQSTGFFFSYENEGKANGIKKPLNHLHVGIMKEYAESSLPEKLLEHKGPHFKAPQMEFHEFMGIIVANFFSEHDDCEDMLRNLGL